MPSDVLEIRYLTVAEIAAVLRVSTMTVYRIIHAGELEVSRFGSTYRVAEGHFRDYLQAATGQ